MVLTPDELGLWAFLDMYGPSSLERISIAAYQDQTDIKRYMDGLIDKGYAVFDEKEKLYKLK
ncbi:MAG: hypothetical protein WC852_03945 [Candidatus Nanoarchaeia archaeon]|jgi:hypothetical protein